MAFQYNGGSIVGMSGDNCVCIASDNRYGQQLHTISTDFPKIFKITDKIFIGLSGLATDIQVRKICENPSDTIFYEVYKPFIVIEICTGGYLNKANILSKALMRFPLT